MPPTDTISRAADLARRTLEGNIHTMRIGRDARTRTGILAGTGKFDALWARDACFASMGALAIGRADAVRGTLETLLDHQFEDGLVPRRIAKDTAEWAALLYVMGVRRARAAVFDTVDRGSPSYKLGASGVICPDANMLPIAVAAEYVERTGDGAFLEAYLPRLERALAWLRAREKDGILEQEPISDWKDTVDRGRLTLYNQVLYFQALRAMARLARRRGGEAAARAGEREAAAEALARRIRERFWDEGRGHFRDSEAVAGFSPDGNLLAIATGLTTAAETERILARCDALLAARTFLPAADPLYPPSRVPWGVRLIGMRLYHDGFAWPWQDALLAIAAARAGAPERARRSLERVAAVALRDDGFYEVYEGEPPRIVRRPLYLSEPGFSWSSGLFLRACEECGALQGPPVRPEGAVTRSS